MYSRHYLIIDGVNTTSLPYKVVIQTPPSIQYNISKSKWHAHDGISGYVSATNRKREARRFKKTITLIRPTNEQIYEFMYLLSKENFDLVSSDDPNIKHRVYYVESYESVEETGKNYTIDVTFVCHPTKFFLNEERHEFLGSSTIKTKGTDVAYPTITVVNVNEKTKRVRLNIDGKDLIITNFDTQATIICDPSKAAVLDKNGNDNTVRWEGDFPEFDSQKSYISIRIFASVKVIVDVNWGWV